LLLALKKKIKAMMYQNQNLPNPFQLIFEKLCSLERTVEELRKEKALSTIETANDELMTVRDAADYLRLSTSTLYGLTSKHQVPFMKQGKRLYFKKEDLRHWVEKGSSNPSSEEQKQQQVINHLRQVKRRKLSF
jgi:excisionase family DNA binding protein